MGRYILHEGGQSSSFDCLADLQLRIKMLDGECVVYYINRSGRCTSLFLTASNGTVVERYKAGQPVLDWALLEEKSAS